MYWHQGYVNTATVCIQRKGEKVRMHICDGANTYFKNNSSNRISCIYASANTGPTCIRANFNSSRFFACMYWFRERKLFLDKVFRELFGSWTSAPKIMDVHTEKCVFFFCGPGSGEKLFDPWASGRKGQECPQEHFWTKKFMFMLLLLP